MFPVVLQVGGLTIFSYGILLAVSFLVGVNLVERRAKKMGIDPNRIVDLAIWILVAVVVGARLLYVIMHWPDYRRHLIDVVAFWRGGCGGLMFYGGFVPALLVGWWFVRRYKLPVLRLFDAAAPAIALGEFLTRIGCFLNGCCFGKPTTLPWGIVFPENCAAGYTFDVPIHPTQLYSSLAGLALFVMVLLLERRRLRAGMLFFAFLLCYALFRFGIDFVRYYEDSGNFLVNQAVSLALAAIAVAGIVLIGRGKGGAAKTKGHRSS